jgi:hypothetical protein
MPEGPLQTALSRSSRLRRRQVSGFMIACLALTPNLMIEVYFGHVGKHAAMLAGSEARTAHLHNLAMFGGFVICVAVMVLVSRIARKAVMRAVAETDKAEGQLMLPPEGKSELDPTDARGRSVH